ncbi:MAG TPA: family 43 glycosylhydrolase, partial [Polyangiaceae bacterium]
MNLRTSIGIRHGASFALFVFVLAACPNAHADYPLVSHRYLADPGSMVYEGRVYLYNSNDDDNAVGGGYTMHSVVCVSSSDMKNWTDHGIVFSVPENASWASNSWAPQPITRDGTIYLYFGNSGSGVGVATSKDPTGGFKDA